jgi:hypothetical protein
LWGCAYKLQRGVTTEYLIADVVNAFNVGEDGGKIYVTESLARILTVIVGSGLALKVRVCIAPLLQDC